MIEQKRRAIDECPGNILSTDEAFVGELLGAEADGTFEGGQLGVDEQGRLSANEYGLVSLEFGDDGPRLFGIGPGFAEVWQLGVLFVVIIFERFLLFSVMLVGS